jgi:hypothetical protein
VRLVAFLHLRGDTYHAPDLYSSGTNVSCWHMPLALLIILFVSQDIHTLILGKAMTDIPAFAN